MRRWVRIKRQRRHNYAMGKFQIMWYFFGSGNFKIINKKHVHQQYLLFENKYLMYYLAFIHCRNNTNLPTYNTIHSNPFNPSIFPPTVEEYYIIIPTFPQISLNLQYTNQDPMLQVITSPTTDSLFLPIQQQQQQGYNYDMIHYQQISKNTSQLKLPQESQSSPNYSLYTHKKKLTSKNKPQTKNLIKNYGRAILTFIMKNQQIRLRVLDHLGIDDGQFVQCICSFRSHIHTISALRYLWQQHPFCQAFRILSCEYLRKYNMQHIFNSRIYKYNIYLKYQDKLMKSLRKPQQFESIKQI